MKRVALAACILAASLLLVVQQAMSKDAIHRTDRDAQGNLLRARGAKFDSNWLAYEPHGSPAGADVKDLEARGIPEKYWDVAGSRVVEMSPLEKIDADADLASADAASVLVQRMQQAETLEMRHSALEKLRTRMAAAGASTVEIDRVIAAIDKDLNDLVALMP